MAGRILRRFITGIEAVVYGPPSIVSSWFHDDPGRGGWDPLAGGNDADDDPTDRWIGLAP